MRALILAGGDGTRLRPITIRRAKQLLPVANRPVLDYGLEAVAQAGITDVGIVVGRTKDEIVAHVGDGRRFGVDVSYVEQPTPLGLAHAVLTAASFLGGDDFVMYLGDNLVAGGISEFVNGYAQRRPAARLLLARTRHPERFGVAELDEHGSVRRLVEKPRVPPSDLAVVGVYVFNSRILDAVRAIRPSARGEFEISDAIQWLVEAGETVHGHVMEGWWKDTGRLGDLLEANRMVLDTLTPRVDGLVEPSSRLQGTVVIEAGAKIDDSIIRGPVIIGSNTVVSDTIIGPYTAVADGCVIGGSEVEHSIILSRARLADIRRLEDSLIGRDVEVARYDGPARSYRLMVGDHSRVALV